MKQKRMYWTAVMFKVRNLLHLFKVKLEDSFRVKPKSISFHMSWNWVIVSLIFSISCHGTDTDKIKKKVYSG